MGYWSWDPSLSVGIDVIDAQHRRIIDYLNELDQARLEQDQERIGQVLLGLVDYTMTHFAFEEDLMQQVDYPLAASHKRVHDSFAAQAKRYLEQHESGVDVSRKVLSELQIWLTNHIKNDDQDYASHAGKHLKQGWLTRTLKRFFG